MNEEVGTIRGLTPNGEVVWSTYTRTIDSAVAALRAHWHTAVSGVHLMKNNKTYCLMTGVSVDVALEMFRLWLKEALPHCVTATDESSLTHTERHLKQQLEKEQARCVELHRCVEELQTKLAGLEAIHEAMKVKPEYAYTQVPTLLLGRFQDWHKHHVIGSNTGLRQLMLELEPYFPKSELELRMLAFETWARQNNRDYDLTPSDLPVNGTYAENNTEEAFQVWCLFTQPKGIDQ